MSFQRLLAELGRDLVGPDLAQARRIIAELTEHGLDDPRKLLAVGGDGGEEVLGDIFPGEVVGNVVAERFKNLWDTVAAAAR